MAARIGFVYLLFIIILLFIPFLGCTEDDCNFRTVFGCAEYDDPGPPAPPPSLCEEGTKRCGVRCVPFELTCCSENSQEFLCSQETPACCSNKEVSVFDDEPFIDPFIGPLEGLQCAATKNECSFTLPLPPPMELFPFSEIVTVPELLTPINNEIIIQNNPNCGCPFDGNVGYGYCFLFDWTDSFSPNGIAGYIFRERPLLSQEELDTSFFPPFGFNEYFVEKSERFKPDEIDVFSERDCNQTVSRCMWEWQVLAVDNLGNMSVPSEFGKYSYSECILEDGTHCPENNFCSFNK